MSDYLKHLITCKCILLQFKHLPTPPAHKFVVFSEMNENGLIVPSLAQCPNCGVVHKVKEVGLTEILRKEDAPSILTIEEIKSGLPEETVNKFSGYDLHLHQWQEISWIVENKKWGKTVILTKDTVEGLVEGKYAQIFGPSLIKISKFSREDILVENT